MLTGSAILVSYFLACFLLSAAIVRAFPKSQIGLRLRRHLFLASVLPALVLIELCKVFPLVVALLHQGVRRSFELLSGQKLMSARSGYFDYGAPVRRKRSRSRS